MKLLVDVGNSRVKWAWARGADLVAQGSAARGDAAWERAILDAGHEPGEIRIANVAGPEMEARLAASFEAQFRLTPVFARSAAGGAGVRNGYTDPAQLGVDRWLALCAAYARHRLALCVVDAGTATTIDMVADDGQHEGGLILAGVDLLQSALMGGTSDLARLSAARGDSVPLPSGNAMALGRDTATAIRQGAALATAHLIAGCLRVRHPLPSIPPLLLLTGGATRDLEPALRCLEAPVATTPVPAFRLDSRPDLVLEGLGLDPPCFAGAR